jgi:hypothetical protein
MFRRQADIAFASLQRLFKADGQTILIAAGDQSRPARGADGGIGVSLQETHAPSGDRVDIRRAEVRTSVAGDIGKAEIVGKDKNDIRRSRGLAERFGNTGGGQCAGRGATQNRAACDVGAHTGRIPHSLRSRRICFGSRIWLVRRCKQACSWSRNAQPVFSMSPARGPRNGKPEG